MQQKAPHFAGHRARRGILAAAAAVVLLAACGGGDDEPTAPSAKAYYKVRMIENLAYGPSRPGNLLDLHLPETGTSGALPLLIWHSGSAWLSNSAKDSEFAALAVQEFTARGFAVATISIRSSLDARFPAQGHDVRAAIRWLRENAATYNLDANRFAFMGDSSGGWAASFAAATSGIAQLPGETVANGTSSAVQVAVAFYPPTEFLTMDAFAAANNLPRGFAYPHDGASSPESLLIQCPGEPAPVGFPDSNPALVSIQSCPDQVNDANPATYMTAKTVPIWVLHGGADPLVPYNQSLNVYNASKAQGSTVKYTFVPAAVHDLRTIIGATTATTRTASGGQEQSVDGAAPTWNDIEQFIRTHLK
ncbi:MAG: alpha/beta hydrolase [Burkholderiaceae bacterium]|nr:alpha/beta hydrolase [Burkholderiaceae bacterium]